MNYINYANQEQESEVTSTLIWWVDGNVENVRQAFTTRKSWVNCQEALPLLREAQHLATHHSTATIRAWLVAVEAEAHAHLHDKHTCFQNLGQAEQILEQAGTEVDLCEVRFDYTRFVGYKGVCFLRLQQPQAALAALNEGTKLIDSASPRQRSIILTDSAVAQSQQGDIEQACEYAMQALMIVDQTKSQLVIQRLRDFRRHIKSWETTSYVREFDEHMALRSTRTS